ncbi:MAG: hypothetical protein ACI9D0_001900 [Bacteroidia bacterium]|jgi:hypothetical protein
MGRIVIAVYKPKPGQEAVLDKLVEGHVGILREQGLATDRPVSVMRAADGTVIEIFEWASLKAIEDAHTNQVVQGLWGEFAAACDFIPLSAVPEAAGMFPDFEAVG